MAGGQKGDGAREADDMFALGLVFFAFVGGLMIWWYFKHAVVVAYFAKFYYWLMFVPAKVTGFFGLEYGPVHTIKQLAADYRKPDDVSFGQLFVLMNKSSMLFYPLLIALFIYRRQALGHVIIQVRSAHGFWSLVKRQSEVFHYIVPSYRFEMYWRTRPDERKKWRDRAEMPDEFAARHKLVKRDGPDIILDNDRTRFVFEELMKNAKRYRTLDNKVTNPLKMMTNYEKALFVIFSTRIVGLNPKADMKGFSRGRKTRADTAKLLAIINNSCAPSNDPKKSFDFDSVAAKANDFLANPVIAGIVHDHSYVHTMLMRLLFESATDGKMPCAHFIWLKIVDKQLWYALQGVTYRQIARNFIVAAPICAQFWAEMVAVSSDQCLVQDHWDHAVPAFEHVLIRSKVITKTGSEYNDTDY